MLSAPPDSSTPTQASPQQGIDAVFAALRSSSAGLSTAEAKRRRAARAQRDESRTGLRRWLPRTAALPESCTEFIAQSFNQCADPPHLVLFLCALAATTLGAPAVAVALVVLTLLRLLLLAALETYANAAQRALEKARRPRVYVRRDHVVHVLDATAIVAGDVVELATGACIPADVRLFENHALLLDPATLPGFVEGTSFDPDVLLANSWVSSGRGVGVVLAAGTEAAGSAMERIGSFGLAETQAAPATENPEAAAPSLPPKPSRLHRFNAVVLCAALIVLLGGLWHGTDLLHSVLGAVVLVAFGWSAHERLVRPLQRGALAHALRRLMALGVLVRGVQELRRLATVPTQSVGSEESGTVVEPLENPVSTASSEDTDRARSAADVAFNAPPQEISRLAVRATQIARSATASAVRACDYGSASAIALLTVTALQALLVAPMWPASVPMGLHFLLFVFAAMLALRPVRGGASRVLHTAADTPLPFSNARRVHVAWCIGLGLASLVALRLAPRWDADRATLAFAVFALSSVAFAWVALLTCGGASWRLRRVIAARLSEVLWFLPLSVITLGASAAVVHVPLLQTAFITTALPRPAWSAASALALAAILVVLTTVWVVERARAKPRSPSTGSPSSVPPSAVSPSAAPPPSDSSSPPTSEASPAASSSTTAPLIAALCLLSALLATTVHEDAHAQDSKSPPANARAALSVTLITPQRADWPQVLSANGNIAAWQEAVIGAETSNYRLTEVRVNVGDVVRKGQLLAQIADDSVAAELAQTKAMEAEAAAQLAEAKANADRARSLQPTGVLSGQQINQILTAEQTAAARLASVRAKVKVDALRLAHTRVLAPDDGVISARNATVGSLAQPGQELFRLIRGNRLEWRAEVTANELARLKPGQRSFVIAPTGERIEGKVRMVAPTVDPQSRTALVYVDLPTTQTALRAGMFARGEFELGRSHALTLPQTAVLLREGFAYVFVLGAEERVLQKKVTLGRRQADRIEILNGLEADTRVVATGAGFLSDGDKVQVVSGAAAAPAASTSAR